MSFNLKQYLQETISLVDQAMESFLPAESIDPADLHRAMRYSVFAGGKRVRPVLMLAACQAVGGKRVHALPAACAMEMIHTYSLIHDDLPAMDDDDFRRGRPTNHKVFGEALAILAGDALLTEAFKLLSDQSMASIDAATRLDVLWRIAVAAGSLGMVGGQVVDMQSECAIGVTIDTVTGIHRRKTGALIVASVTAGGLLGGGTPEQIAALEEYGRTIGLAFQVADDILDIEGTTEELGKDAGSDEARGKATYPSLLGLSESKRYAKELVDSGLLALTDFGEAAEPLRAIARYIIERKN